MYGMPYHRSCALLHERRKGGVRVNDKIDEATIRKLLVIAAELPHIVTLLRAAARVCHPDPDPPLAEPVDRVALSQALNLLAEKLK